MLPADVADLPAGAVALAGDVEPVLTGDHQLTRRHLVQRQRPGLVRADGRGRPQGLDRGQPFDDGMSVRDLPGAHREQSGDHRGQPRGNGGDRQGDAGDEQRVEGLAPGQAQDDHQDQRGGGDQGDDLGQRVQLLLQRRLGGLGVGQHVGDVPDLGLHPGRRHHELATAAGDRGVHEGHAGAVAEGDLVAGHRLGGLADREALARERRLLDLQRRGHPDASVGGHAVAGLDEDDVTGHEVVRLDLDGPTVTPYPRHALHHRGQRLHARLGLRLLPHADDRVEDGQTRQHHGGPGISGHHLVHDRGHQEHDLHEVLVLAQECAPARFGLLLREAVGAVLADAPSGLVGGQSQAGVDVEPVGDSRGRGAERLADGRLAARVDDARSHGGLQLRRRSDVLGRPDRPEATGGDTTPVQGWAGSAAV